jgi:hypothetical protein
MIRKVIIVVLTLAAVVTITAWVVSHTVHAIDVDKHTVAYSWGRDYSFQEPTDPESMWLLVAFRQGTLHLTRWNFDARRRLPASRRWRWLGFSLATGTRSRIKPPYSLWSLQIPLWCPIVLFAFYPTIAFIRGPLRRYRRRRKGLCLKCGYDLTGNVSGVCPECGAEVPSPDDAHHRMDP